MDSEEKVLWIEHREGYGWFTISPATPSGMRFNPAVYGSVEEAVEKVGMSSLVTKGVFKQVEADSAAGEVLAYEGQVVQPSRMVLRRPTARDYAETDAFEQGYEQKVKEGNIRRLS